MPQALASGAKQPTAFIARARARLHSGQPPSDGLDRRGATHVVQQAGHEILPVHLGQRDRCCGRGGNYEFRQRHAIQRYDELFPLPLCSQLRRGGACVRCGGRTARRGEKQEGVEVCGVRIDMLFVKEMRRRIVSEVEFSWARWSSESPEARTGLEDETLARHVVAVEDAFLGEYAGIDWMPGRPQLRLGWRLLVGVLILQRLVERGHERPGAGAH